MTHATESCPQKAMAATTKPDPNDENARHHRHGHLIELRECDWRCLICGHWFDAASDADLFWCGDECKHPGDPSTSPGSSEEGDRS